ncbi:unnamed protein product, partial [Clonostachys byssicola]
VKIYDCHCRLEDNGTRNSQGYYAFKKLTSHNPKLFELELSSLVVSGHHDSSRQHISKCLQHLRR